MFIGIGFVACPSHTVRASHIDHMQPGWAAGHGKALRKAAIRALTRALKILTINEITNPFPHSTFKYTSLSLFAANESEQRFLLFTGQVLYYFLHGRQSGFPSLLRANASRVSCCSGDSFSNASSSFARVCFCADLNVPCRKELVISLMVRTFRAVEREELFNSSITVTRSVNRSKGTNRGHS
jgi:hypothetical protein